MKDYGGKPFPDIDDLKKMKPDELDDFKLILLNSFGYFDDYVFFLLYNARLIWNPIQQIIGHTLHKIDIGEWRRVILNVMPRAGKTETASTIWPAWHYCRNSACGFMEISYSDEFIKDVSVAIKTVLNCAEIKFLFRTKLKKDSSAKSLWRLSGGGWLRVVSLQGAITGFGAGRLGWPSFIGAIIIDDPNKPEEAKSAAITERTNKIFSSTIKNRVNDPRLTPILVNAQRTGDMDLCSYLLGGGSGEKWIHVRIPAKVSKEDTEFAAERYRTDWDHGIPVDLGLPDGFVWEQKYGEKQDAEMAVLPDIQTAQFYQNPRISGGSVFSTGWFKRYDRVLEMDGTGLIGSVAVNGKKVEIKRMSIFADTAQTDPTKRERKGKDPDWSCFQLWGVGTDDNIYLLDILRGQWQVPDLTAESTRFLNRYADKSPRRYGWRDVFIENKSSGTGLIQQLGREWGVGRVMPIERGPNRDKVSRALGAILPMMEGRVYVPQNAPWLATFLQEISEFSKNDTHLHDDQVDPMVDAIELLISKGASIFDCI